MKFSVSSSALLSLLATTGKVISNKNTLPILDYFLMELKGDELRVTTSDLETTLVGSIRVDGVESEGTIAAPAKLMLDSLKEFAEMPLTIEVNDQNWEIRLSWKSGSLSIPGASAVSYPAIPALSADCKELTLDVDVLVNGINKTIFATADDELRPVMNGVYINLAPSMLTFVGTDAHKLVKYEVETANEVASSFILPKKPATLLKNMLGKDVSEVTIRFDERNAEITFDDCIIICRLIEGRYPNYNAVIPLNNPNHLTVDRVALLSALRRVQPFASSSNLVRFHIENSVLQLDAEDYDFSKTATERMACDYNGLPMSIGFNGSSFIDMLSNFECQDIVIQLADPSRSGVLVPSEQPEGQDVLMLLMPMLLNE